MEPMEHVAAVPERARNRRNYQDNVEWENDPDFREWIAPLPGVPARALCTWCNKDFFARNQILRKHMESTGHQQGAHNRDAGGENPNNPVENARVQQRRVYRNEWENMPEFRECIRVIPENPARVICTFCNRELDARIDTIQDHLRSGVHRRHFLNRLPDDVNMIDYLNNDEIIDRKVDRAKLKLAGLIAEHNLPFLLVDCLIPVLKDICDDPDCREIWDRLSMNRHDVSKIIRYCTRLQRRSCKKIERSKVQYYV